MIMLQGMNTLHVKWEHMITTLQQMFSAAWGHAGRQQVVRREAMQAGRQQVVRREAMQAGNK